MTGKISSMVFTVLAIILFLASIGCGITGMVLVKSNEDKAFEGMDLGVDNQYAGCQFIDATGSGEFGMSLVYFSVVIGLFGVGLTVLSKRDKRE